MNKDLIAFQGEIELLNASWDLENGRMVEFRICGEAYGRIHPFKKYQQRRGGRVGSRFEGVVARSETSELLFEGSLMLAGWKDSSTVGQSVKFWLDDEVAMHPFAGCTRRKNGTPGDMFALILVELNDDDTPVNQEQREKLHSSESAAGNAAAVHDRSAAPGRVQAGSETDGKADQKAGVGPSRSHSSTAGTGRSKKFSSSVHLLITSPLYVRWLQETKGTLVKCWTPELARQYTKKVVHIESLSDLDRDREAVKRFHELIQRPYARWHSQEP